MSSNPPNSTHGRYCACTACNHQIRSIGSLFPPMPVRPPANALNPQTAGQPLPVPVTPGNPAAHAWPNLPQAQGSWTTWTNDPAFRTAFVQGTRPAQHPYPMDLQIDEPAPSAPQQRRSPNVQTRMQGNGPQPGASGGPGTNASGIAAASGAQTPSNSRPPPGYNNNNSNTRPTRSRTSSTDATYRSSNTPQDMRRQNAGGSSCR